MTALLDLTIAWIFVLAMAGNAWIARKIAGYWLNLGSIYGVFWMAMSTLPLSISFGSPINPLAIAYILFTSLAVTLSMLPFDWKHSYEVNKGKASANDMFATRGLLIATLGFSLVGIVASIAKVLSAGFSILQLLTNTLETAGAFAASRYEGELESTTLGKLGLMSSYLAVFAGGLFAASTSNRALRALAIVAALLPALLTATLQSAKGLLFLSLAFLYGAVLVARIYNKNYVLFTIRDVKVAGIGTGLLLPFIIASFLARGLTQTNDISYITDRILGYLISYSSGHLYAFSDWFTQFIGDNSLFNYAQPDTIPGFFSFLFAFRLWGDSTELPPGLYAEYFKHGEFLQSNIYTAFRGAILDFGILGSLVAFYLAGTAGNLIFRHLLHNRRSAMAISLFLFSIGAIYMSYIVSILTWSVVPASIAMLSILLTMHFAKFKLI